MNFKVVYAKIEISVQPKDKNYMTLPQDQHPDI